MGDIPTDASTTKYHDKPVITELRTQISAEADEHLHINEADTRSIDPIT